MPRTMSEEIIAVERSALDRWGAGDPSGYLDIYAPDVTYFDPVTAARIDGLEAMREYYRPWTGKIRIDRYEMLNPRVVVTDDMAVLSYNLIDYSKQPDGSEKPAVKWNSTAVFRRIDGKWRTIHSHWSFTKPELKDVASE